MRRIVSAAMVVSLVGAGSLTAAIPSAGAAPPPTLSVTSGAPGTEVEVTVADCVTDPDGDTIEIVQALLISGTAPDEVLAGGGSSDDGTATVVVPDWIDPAEPATIEASCFELDFESELPVITPHDPVAFDVLPGPGPATQLRTYNRTSVQAGQGIEVDGEGCNLPGAEFAGVDVFVGGDLTGRTFEEIAGFGEGELTGSDYLARVVLSNGFVDLDFSFEDGDPPVLTDLQVIEGPTSVPPGDYTAVSYCAADDGTTLLYEPQLITVTGDAPIDEMDLTATSDGEQVTLAGTSCTSGPVDVFLEGVSFDDVDEPFLRFGPTATSALPRAATSRSGLAAAATAAHAVSPQGLADDQFLEVTVDPDVDGSWAVTDDTGFEQGVVFGYAVCGDPFEDGWVYDPQGVAIEADSIAPPPPPAVPPAAPPAPVVEVAPTYAG